MTTFQIPRILQQHAGGRPAVELQGATIRALLDDLNRNYPALYQCICNETGAIRQHVNLFVNSDFLRDRGGLDARLEPGDVVSIFQAVSGG